jgi:serine/threonine-protein kinase TTK/MPS1
VLQQYMPMILFTLISTRPNFLLVRGRLKLIDFGIASAIDVDNTVNVHRDNHDGTVNFMSLESLQDSSAVPQGSDKMALGRLMKIGKPSDIWSLRCILYQMVYGQPPFGHISTMAHRALAIIDHSVAIDFPS